MMVLPMGPWGGGGATFYQITNSLLFRGSQKLYRSFTSSSTWGLSVWVRRNALGAVNPILGSAVKFNASDTLTAGSLTTTAVYRDPTAWMHIAIAGGRLWVNGIDMGATTTSAFTCSATNCLGYDGTNYLNAGIAEFAFTDDAQPSSAPGRTDSVTGSWVPIAVSATWGTNGCYLGKPWDSASLGADYSGQGNNWTPSGFAAGDLLADRPTNIYVTLNPLAPSSLTGAPTYSEGNSKLSTASGLFYGAHGTIPIPSSGKWYFEAENLSATSGAPCMTIGLSDAGVNLTGNHSTISGVWCFNFQGTRYLNLNGTSTTYAASGLPINTTCMVAVDVDNGKVWFGIGGSWYSAVNTVAGDPAAGTSPTVALNATGKFPFLGNYGTITNRINFGQRAFTYTPPTGFKTLCTANLPATSGIISGAFTGNASADGQCIYTGAVPQSLTINGNAVTWGTHADKLATGFKLRTSSASYNSTSTNNWTATYSTPQKPTVGSNKIPSNAQGNP